MTTIKVLRLNTFFKKCDLINIPYGIHILFVSHFEIRQSEIENGMIDLNLPASLSNLLIRTHTSETGRIEPATAIFKVPPGCNVYVFDFYDEKDISNLYNAITGPYTEDQTAYSIQEYLQGKPKKKKQFFNWGKQWR